jgi:cytochrome c553
LGAEIASRRFDGGEAENWWAPPLNGTSPSPVPWSEESLFNYLRSWDSGHGGAVGPMAPVVAALARVPEADVRAIAIYVNSTLNSPRGEGVIIRTKMLQGSKAGAQLYAGNCATCHETGGQVPFTTSAIEQHTSLHAPDPRNVIHVILEGIHPPEGAVGAIMPSFVDTLSQAQIADIVGYMRTGLAGEPQWENIADEISRLERRTRP